MAARFRGLGAFVVNGKRYKAGQAYADSAGAALAGDVVWAITSSNYSPMLAPLDAGAIAIKAGSIHSGANLVCCISGANSIEA
jgi:hypothetical protein